MEVYIGNISPNLDSSSIERFIFAVVKHEQVFGSGRMPEPYSSLAPAPPLATAPVPINRGFFFKLIVPRDGRPFGILTFARKKVGAWFVEYAQWQPYVLKHRLVISPGRNQPLRTFVDAIAENATDRQPSASVHKLPHKYAFGLAQVGYWAAPFRFSYTHSFVGERLRISADEKNIIHVELDHSSLTFLPRDVKTYTRRKVKPTAYADGQPGWVFLFELKQNPQMYGDLARTDDDQSFRLPTRVVRIVFGNDQPSNEAAKRLWQEFDVLLNGVPELNLRRVQLHADNYAPFLRKFFERSKSLEVELAFLRETLLRNELLNMSALTKLSPRLDQLIQRGQQALALRVLKNLTPKLEARKERGSDEEQALRITNRLWDEASAEAVANDSNGLLTFLDPSSAQHDDDYMSPMLHIDVTPTRVLLSGPQMHVSNRVIRAYPGQWRNFARVMFTNEDREGATTIKPNFGFAESERYIRTRVLDILTRGLTVAGRHWEMLAWSSSSMSTHTVWFVTPFYDADGRFIDADVIRRRLGDFSDVLRCPAMYGARLSQAFSATARTIQVASARITTMPDIKTDDGKLAYTDGVGQISPQLMADVWDRYVTIHGEQRKRKLLQGTAPSAIQIRIGGHKGVLAVNPRLQGSLLVLRPSMSKFKSRHKDLEVANSSARCLSAKLNRPLINALDDRGVPPTAFMAIQDEAIAHIGRARTSFDETARLCSAFSFGTGCNLRALFEKLHRFGLGAATVDSGSFFLVLAKSVTAAALGDMKRKARIPVRGVTLLGIADEFGFLNEGEVFAQVETVESGQIRRRVLEGRKLIGRSPTVDPGDIAMVTCVRPPPGHPLLQLRNVVVFNTCSRDEPLPRRLGGGDLDGDLYTIYEDERLFPDSAQPRTVFHAKTQPKVLDRACRAADLAHFFTDFMLNDFVGLVSHLHLRIADASEYGSLDSRCKELAMLHSRATDFRKTGVAVKRRQLPHMEEPIIPDFLAQGEKKQGRLTYSSTRVLGYLFRAVSWNETDTPSLDNNTDPETGLEPDYDEEYLDDDAAASEFGSEFSSLVEPPMASAAARDPSVRATVGSAPGSLSNTQPGREQSGAESVSRRAAPWQFKDATFPALLERIVWANSHFLPVSQLHAAEDEPNVIDEGHRYVALFMDFTRALRQVSRNIASYHPSHDAPGAGGSASPNAMAGASLVSEVHLLTGRLPWAKVARKTRSDRDNSLLDSMQSVCTLLRKKLCRISEANAFPVKAEPVVATSGLASRASSVASRASTPRAGSSGVASRAASVANRASTPQGSRGQGVTVKGSGRNVGLGTLRSPIEIDSDSSDDDATVLSGSSRSLSAGQQRTVLGTLTNTASDGTPNWRSKRKASQDTGLRRGQPRAFGTSNASRGGVHGSSDSVLSRISVSSGQGGEDEVEEGELTVVTGQEVVDSLWRACCFFASPCRPRYSNVYGYNTFMMTLTLHLLSMIETLRHLHRTTIRRKNTHHPSTSTSSASTTADGKDYSLTEDLAAMTLGSLLIDLSPTNLAFDP